MKSTPNSSKNDLVVLMPARNEEKNIPEAIMAVNHSENIGSLNPTIYVCANACTDNTINVLDSMKKTQRNMDYVTEWVPGKPRALNALLDKAEEHHSMGTNDVVLFLDADARVMPDTIGKLSGALRQHRDLKAVSANDIAEAPATTSLMDHLLFGITDVSLSSLASRDRKSSCTAVRADAVKGVRFPEHVIADDLWLNAYLGFDSVDTHPDAVVLVDRPKNFVSFAAGRIRHMMGLYQLEEFFPAHEVRENLPMGTHEHVQAFASAPELQRQFAALPGVYKLGSVIALPIHAALKTAAWIGQRVLPQPRNESTPIPQAMPAPSGMKTPSGM